MPVPGLPDSTCADELNDTPDGSVPDSVTDGAGDPVAVTVNEALAPTENVAEPAEVSAGTWLTVRVNCWVAGVPVPLLAANVTG